MFTGTFRCIQSVGALEPEGSAKEEQRHLVTLKPVPLFENKEAWNGAPDGLIQLGKLPPGVAHDFKLGQWYKVTIEPICESETTPQGAS